MSTVYGDTFLPNLFNSDSKISSTSALQSWNYTHFDILSQIFKSIRLLSRNYAKVTYGKKQWKQQIQASYHLNVKKTTFYLFGLAAYFYINMGNCICICTSENFHVSPFSVALYMHNNLLHCCELKNVLSYSFHVVPAHTQDEWVIPHRCTTAHAWNRHGHWIKKTITAHKLNWTPAPKTFQLECSKCIHKVCRLPVWTLPLEYSWSSVQLFMLGTYVNIKLYLIFLNSLLQEQNQSKFCIEDQWTAVI